MIDRWGVQGYGLGLLEMAHATKWLVGLAILGTGDLEG